MEENALAPFETAIWLILYYAGLVFFDWTIRSSIKSGDAGASGIELSKKKHPVRFWIRIIGDLVAWLFMALLPHLILSRKHSPD